MMEFPEPTERRARQHDRDRLERVLMLMLTLGAIGAFIVAARSLEALVAKL